jgi:Glycosyltransferase family 9 (heptosyltransferase)
MSENDLKLETIELDFLHEHAQDKQFTLTEQQQAAIARIHTALLEANQVFICLGGRAGRLGESIVGTALLEGMLQALRYAERDGIPVSVIVDRSVLELFNAEQYQEDYWPQITLVSITQPEAMEEVITKQATGRHVLVVDCHGTHDGMPYLRIQSDQEGHKITTLARLFRVSIRSYAQRGSERRYADFIEELFGLPPEAISGTQAQPTLRLSAQDKACYPELALAFDLNPAALQIICFFQSVVRAKCYEYWHEVMQLLCEYTARHFPQQQIDFLFACGPEEDLPESVKQAALIEEFQDFTDVQQNARVLVRTTPSLHDLAILMSKAALVLANDTGPGHMAGALRIPTITPYLPGNIYSKRVWSSTLWHHGVTLEPNPYSYRELESAVIWDNPEPISSIPPQNIFQQVLQCLPGEMQL